MLPFWRLSIIEKWTQYLVLTRCMRSRRGSEVGGDADKRHTHLPYYLTSLSQLPMVDLNAYFGA